ncbi:MAG TPA: hypothetical protein DDW27_10320 [Bacteroidales bacterium]|nr:hypothetical protein [Bacteroidales bacterium]
MASLIHGYEYDIFISYRQKDNKGDRWVSEFVEALKTELESTFKEEISVYFDINPSDYLLETYDVDASLKDKLKCLVFIPVISRTYCDPKSFAWNYEFKAFTEQVSGDQFGLKVKLPNGNVASRILPVRIHDLDTEDIKLCESVTGGFLRGVDFIYKEPGVNRPLRSNEENPHDNLNHTIYRNQINKVALAVKDIIESMKISDSPAQLKHKGVQAIGSKKEIIIEEPVKKEIIKLKQKAKEEKIKFGKGRRFPLFNKQGILIPGSLATLVILGVVIFLLIRNSTMKWAKEKALTEIEQLIFKSDIAAAFKLVQKADKYISKDPEFQELSSLVMSDLTILTDPPGASVFTRNYADTIGKWKKLGITPIESLKMPSDEYYQVRIEKSGYENLMAVIRTGIDTLYRKLFKQVEIPPGMVYVEGYKAEEAGNYLKVKNGFFIDRYEVTNKQYKEFVENGGYRNQKYWKHEFKKDGKVIRWEEVMSLFVDKTGRPGPFTWEAGDYPDSQDEYPVSGISWYEAAAYAEYAGKSLPTAEHWGSAVGFYIPYIDNTFGSRILPLSNFLGKGSDKAGKFPGISCFGAYDMAGNVREWCWNETPVGHIIRGGAWNDPIYMYSDMSQLPSFNRSEKNGFRCVKYIDKEKIPENAFKLIENIEGWAYYSGNRDFSKETPVEDKIFEIYKNQFLYDKTDLNARVEQKDLSNKDWIIEKITFDAAYGRERMIAYLFFPTNASPPFQTLVFWPGLNAVFEDSLIKGNWKWNLDFILKSGRAVMYPEYYRTFERKDGPLPMEGHKLTEWLIKACKDFRRSIDYLETRSDIDTNKLGFYGISWGGSMGWIPAIEGRLKLNILIIGGFNGALLPEVHAINYLSRVKIPTLMLNGRYDYRYNIDINVEPFFDLLGTPSEHKRLKVYNTDHYVPKDEMIREVLAWCDKYLGPVKPKSSVP